MPDNQLYYGDNLEVLRRDIRDESVDLIYLDPPFNSNRKYSVLFREKSGTEAQAQIEAFDDTWIWSQESETVYLDVLNGDAPNQVKDALEAMRRLLGDNDVLAYLVMMSVRLIELRRVLKRTGSLYLHCDPNASHYLKIMLDAIFGPRQFVNEVIWHHNLGAMRSTTNFPTKHDTLLFYAKGSTHTFTVQRGEVTKQMKAKYSHQDGGGFYMMSYGKKYYLKGGKPFDDVWDISTLGPTSPERLGY